jgi:hypothetical protein
MQRYKLKPGDLYRIPVVAFFGFLLLMTSWQFNGFPNDAEWNQTQVIRGLFKYESGVGKSQSRSSIGGHSVSCTSTAGVFACGDKRLHGREVEAIAIVWETSTGKSILIKKLISVDREVDYQFERTLPEIKEGYYTNITWFIVFFSAVLTAISLSIFTDILVTRKKS